MTLLEKQQLFARLAAALILRATALGFEVTLGEAYRSKEEAERLSALGKGSKVSLHQDRLAIDLNLFRNGAYLTRTEDYTPLGDWWKAQHALCRWGGDFATRKDGNHFSLAHGGRA
jgi:hypothetical protein